MSKVLLICADYNELIKLDASLKRLGFDVLSITNEFSFSQQMLTFNPDIVVGSGSGPRVNALSLGKRLKQMVRWSGKVGLIFPVNQRPSSQDVLAIRSDINLEAPVSTSRLFSVICILLGLNEAQILERYKKVQQTSHSLTKSEAIMLKGELAVAREERADGKSQDGSLAQSSEIDGVEEQLKAQKKAQEDLQRAYQSSAGKAAKYREISKDIKISAESTITRVKAHQLQQELAADSDSQSSSEQDELRIEFTKALFKK